jgi:hypothetical protein
MTESIVTGQCLCGSVRFEVELPSIWCAHCHCGMCRRAHGAAFVTWVGFSRDRVRVVAGDQLGRYQSSPPATRSFCRQCGSPLFFESERWADQIHVALASLDGPIDRPPAAHVFYSDRALWFEATDELPRRGGATGTEVLD